MKDNLKSIGLNEEYDISVTICTYHPVKEKLFETIDSILKQEDVHLQVIIADDGSETDYFDDAKRHMEHQGFYSYKFVKNKTNKGTVYNFLNAVSACDSNYIKAISPGDMLLSAKTMRRWLDAVIEAGYEWSFGDAVYYERTPDGRMNFLEKTAHPRDVSVYIKKDFHHCRINYLINKDNCLGAAILLTKRAAQKYLNIIAGKIIYTEDNIFYLMMLDGLVPLYYHDAPVLYYEFGSGISTAGNTVWSERITKDRNAVFDIILQQCSDLLTNGFIENKDIYNWGFTAIGDSQEELELARRVKRAIIINSRQNKIIKRIAKIFNMDMFTFYIQTKIKRRKTTTIWD